MPAIDPSSALTSSKSSFLISQIRILSQPLHIPSSSTPGLSDTAIDKILTQLNKKIASHNRLQFGIESQRHVVEQIDGVYWRDVLAGGLPVRQAETCVMRDADLTESGNALPEKWEDAVLNSRSRKRKRTEDQRPHEADLEVDVSGSIVYAGIQGRREPSQIDPQAQRFAQAREKLRSQTARRDELRKKSGQYKKLQKLLRPFENAQESIQPNLVMKDNKELENELARMRVLLARVGSKTQNQQHEVREQRDQPARETVMTDTKRLEAVLGLG